MKWALLMELSPDNPGGWVAGMGGSGGELFNKSCSYFYVVLRRGLGFSVTGAHRCGRRMLTLIERKISTLHECMSPSPLFEG